MGQAPGDPKDPSDCPPLYTGLSDAQRQKVAHAYWNMKMRENESLDSFILRVRRIEKSLGYEFKDMGEREKLEMWLSRLTPSLRTAICEQNPKTLEAALHCAKKAQWHERIQHAREYQRIRMKSDDTLQDFFDRLHHHQAMLSYYDDERGPERRRVDTVLSRLSNSVIARLLDSPAGMDSLATEESLMVYLGKLSRDEKTKAKAVVMHQVGLPTQVGPPTQVGAPTRIEP
ncbi:hypothetical protein HDK77DRAFT_143193 [Phyllosticta capitalensis]|uniref:Retrotransposon gag domain-containing protein n=2 Tax=Phyllosticta capitalensis TaxID=121624 RepID=A0ABR1Y9Z6_9PEZI